MKVSIVTPTYNRKHTLFRLYESIKNLEGVGRDDFEWLIIDDGSSDGTGLYVEQVFSDVFFNIKYYYQSNLGKPSAINNGVCKANGEYIFIVDSDDVITCDSIAAIIEADLSLNKIKDNDISGFCFRKGMLDGGILGSELDDNASFFMGATDCGSLFEADLAYVFRKESMLKHPFPVFHGEKFVPELFIWNKITDENKVMVFPNRMIYLCEYLADGLSNNFNSQIKLNPKGFSVYYKDQIKRERSFYNKTKRVVRLFQCYMYLLFRFVRSL